MISRTLFHFPLFKYLILLVFVLLFLVSTVPAVAQVGMRVHYVIGAVVSGIVLLLCLALVLLFCCCRKKRVVKNKEHHSSQYDSRSQTQVAPPPPYYTNGMENKGLEKSMDVIEDTLKNFNGQNGYISYNGLHHQPNGNGSKIGEDDALIQLNFLKSDSCENLFISDDLLY